MSVVTKSYVDAMAAGITLNSSKPTKPNLGDAYYDQNNMCTLIWDGNTWVMFSSGAPAPPPRVLPNSEELEKHPTLKEAWEQYLVIRKLLGI